MLEAGSFFLSPTGLPAVPPGAKEPFEKGSLESPKLFVAPSAVALVCENVEGTICCNDSWSVLLPYLILSLSTPYVALFLFL